MSPSELLAYGFVALVPLIGVALHLLPSRRNLAAASVRFSGWARQQQFAPSPINAIERAIQLTAFSRRDGRFGFVESAASSSRSGSCPAQTFVRWTSASRAFPGSLHITRDPAHGGGRPLPSYPALLAFAQTTGRPYVAYATDGPNIELTEQVIEHLPHGRIRSLSIGGSEITIVFEGEIASEALFDAFLHFVTGLTVEGRTLVWQAPVESPFRG